MNSDIEAVLRRAYERFKKYTNRQDTSGSVYLPTPVDLTQQRPILREQFERDQNSLSVDDPFHFLTGLGDTGVPIVAPLPSLSVIVGEYGNGKTELIYRICDRLWQFGGELLPLPVALADCRVDRGILDLRVGPSREDFCSFIFQNVASETSLKSRIVELIQEGHVLLFLDGLDEIVKSQTHYQNFFSGLGCMLWPNVKKNLSRAVVSIRLENISNLDPRGRTLAQRLKYGGKGRRIKVFFLHLDFFSTERVGLYLSQRVPEASGLFMKIRENDQLMSTLRRPLLLKIFGDLVSDADPQEISRLLEIAEAAQLIESYIDKASSEAKVSQEKLSEFIWDNDLLAFRTLRLYREGRVHLVPNDVRAIIKIGDWVESLLASHLDPFGLSDEDVLLGVHKCPFLILADEPSGRRLSFAHRCFLEYFTALGMVKGVVASKGRPTSDLDNLVLNVDMRKFLRSLLQESNVSFDDVTRRSYGLEECDLWNFEVRLEAGDKNWKQLDDTRINLMYAMTDPDHPPKETDKYVRRFLEMEGWGLHPGYLMYNHEAVAVYLLYRRWSKDGRSLSSRYSKILEARLGVCLGRDPVHPKLESVTWLLVERIFHIALRLRYRWVLRYPEMSEEILARIPETDVDTRNRIAAIFGDINNSVF